MVFQKWQAVYAIFPTLVFLHLFLAPYTKVEESFNIQATYDILAYGVPTSNVYFKFKALFDHMTFPGAVPRTFVGALIISGVAKPFIWLADFDGENEQICVRAILGMFNAVALVVYSDQIGKAYGKVVALWYVFYQASQFHILYYASRTLPNMYAFCLSTLALAAFLPVPSSKIGPIKRRRLGLYLMTLATVVFRSELALLLGSQGLWMLFKSQSFQARISLIRTAFVPAIVSATLVGLVLSIGIDTYFWQSSTWIWPELEAFLSNVFPSSDNLGASAWGTSPWYWYFTSAIPRLLMSHALLFQLRLGQSYRPVDGQILDALVPSLLYTSLYSILPHKETRFLFPIVPSLTLSVALSASWYTNRVEKSVMNRIWVMLFACATIANAVLSHCILLPMSAQNYPGANALTALHTYHTSLPISQRLQSDDLKNPVVRVHLTNLALQSGVTRFLEQPNCNNSAEMLGEQLHTKPLVLPGSPDGRNPALTLHPKPSALPQTNRKLACPRWVYDKSSNDTLFLEPSFWSQFDYAIVENPERVIGAWEVVDEVKGIGKPRILQPHDQRRHLFYNPDNEAEEGLSPASMKQLLQAMYGRWVGEKLYLGYALAHDLLRENVIFDILQGQGQGRRLSITRGYWVDWGMETKLYILKSSHSGVKPNTDQKSAVPSSSSARQVEEQVEEMLGLPDVQVEGDEGGNGVRKEINFDALGPMVVNKDGTLSRIDNWKDMTEQERARTIAYLKKRNQLRLDNVEADEQGRTE